MLFVEFRERAVEHGLADDQLADEIHDRIDTRGIHAEGAFGNGGSRRAGSCCFCRFVGLDSFRAGGNKLGRLSLEQIAQ